MMHLLVLSQCCSTASPLHICASVCACVSVVPSTLTVVTVDPATTSEQSPFTRTTLTNLEESTVVSLVSTVTVEVSGGETAVLSNKQLTIL